MVVGQSKKVVGHLMLRRNRLILIGVLVLGIIAVVGAVVLKRWAPSGTATVHLDNQSNQTVDRGHIAVCDQEHAVRGLKPRQTALIQFEVRRDCHYAVRLEMASGSVREATLGYVSRGLSFQDRIIVTDGDIRLAEARRIERLKR
jgi:hypothetical protein